MTTTNAITYTTFNAWTGNHHTHTALLARPYALTIKGAARILGVQVTA